MKITSTVYSDKDTVELTIENETDSVTTTMDKEEYLQMVAETAAKPKVIQ